MLKNRLHIIRFNDWRFLQLSAFLVVLMFIGPIIADAWLVKVISSFVFLNSIFVVFSTENEAKHHHRWVLVLWGLSVVFSLFSVFLAFGAARPVFEVLATASGSAMVLVLVFDILSYIFKKEQITFDSIFAALSVYLMIALLFSQLYSIIFHFQPGSFRFPEAEISFQDSALKNNMFYFSMVTIATLGYGDIVPVSNVARMLTVLEAVIGQFFVAVVVALLVGKIVLNMSHTNK